ncbi:acyl-coenzyme A thioesterase PaaI-like protein [Catenulispora sp. GAS73]|uniref:hypothetical protein n=1 Tax=Catenulispora sp. GAS73 TaxID=3156269 RepID=UPI0035118C89
MSKLTGSRWRAQIVTAVGGCAVAVLAVTASPASASTAAPRSGDIGSARAYSSVSGPITVDLTVNPSATTVGGQVTLTATLTNNTSSVTSGALGIENPDWANQHITSVSVGCRNVVKTIYCGNSQLQAGATMTLKVTLTATATGTDSFTAYGRITNVNDKHAYGTLTVS